MIRVLIIGLGSIAKKHITALRSLSVEFDISALRSFKDPEQYEDVKNIFNLDDTNFDFAIISNPTYLHFKYIKLLASKSIPLFIEKPAVHDLTNIDEILNLVAKKKLTTYVACNLRFHPCLKFLKEKINNQDFRINEINVYCGSYLPDWRPGVDFKNIYSSIPKMGGGVHLDVFHEIDYVTWIFGQPKSHNSVKRSVSSLSIDSIDYANYIIHYEKFTTTIILNYYRRRAKRELEIVFDDNSWTVDLIDNEIKNDEGDLIFKSRGFELSQTYKSQLSYFIDCLKEKKQPMNSLADSIPALEICLKNAK
jgi:predicted dehydrogenase